MKEFLTTQRQMLRDLRQSPNWVAAEINHGSAETIRYACEIKIPRNSDWQVFSDAAYRLIHELGLSFEVHVCRLQKNGEVSAMLFTAQDPKLVIELVNCKHRDIGKVNQSIQFFIHEREQNPTTHAENISAFQKLMHGQTITSYHIFPDFVAVRTGESYRSQVNANRHTEIALRDVALQELAEKWNGKLPDNIRR